MIKIISIIGELTSILIKLHSITIKLLTTKLAATNTSTDDVKLLIELSEVKLILQLYVMQLQLYYWNNTMVIILYYLKLEHQRTVN